MSALLVVIDVAAGIFLLSVAFPALVHMGWSTKHRFRLIYWLLAVGAAGMAISPLVDDEWRRYAHVAVIVALALQELLERRSVGVERDRRDPDRIAQRLNT